MSRVTEEVLSVLEQGKIILYPTDTIWGIGCDATNKEAVQQIYQLKKREESKALICLVSDEEMLRSVVREIEESIANLLDESESPTTIIYTGKINRLAPNLLSSDGSVGIRLVQDEFCREFIQEFGKPIVSTSANLSGEPSPNSFDEINEKIIDRVDYVVHRRKEEKLTRPSKIVKLDLNKNIQIIRA